MFLVQRRLLYRTLGYWRIFPQSVCVRPLRLLLSHTTTTSTSGLAQSQLSKGSRSGDAWIMQGETETSAHKRHRLSLPESQQGTANSGKTDISHAPNTKSSGYPSVNDARCNTVWGDESELSTSKNQVRLVDVLAGQIATGWDAGCYGIPRDIITQTDRATLWALVSTAEALNIGMGGTESLVKMFKDRREEKDVPNDILAGDFHQHHCWVDQPSPHVLKRLSENLCGSLSLEIASDTLLYGKAKVMIADGFDDISEENSYEFANTKATSPRPRAMPRLNSLWDMSLLRCPVLLQQLAQA
ncbi:hypothetical protein M405DRAFT_869854 [Rhizopogon salebrosus TDB-379]|nr:hypothetical protein M405DRAFT_869854 [Rhizopogon salebrosus TDB-379]